MNGKSGLGILSRIMSDAAIRFQDVLKRRVDPRKERPASPPEPPENPERHRRVTGLLPEDFWGMPMPEDPEASVRTALAEERDNRP